MSKAAPESQPNRAKGYRRTMVVNVVIALAALFLINFAVSGSDARVDLTANKRFSVNDGTAALLKKLKAPIRLRYYLSVERPSDLASLEGDIVGRLRAIADAVGPEYVRFNPKDDLILIEGSVADWLEKKENRELGVQETRVTTNAGELRYISCLTINHKALNDPIKLSVNSPSAMEYNLALKVVEINKKKILPEGNANNNEAFMTRIDRPFALTYYVSGSTKPDAGKSESPMPEGYEDLAVKVERVLRRIAELSPAKIDVKVVKTYNHKLRNEKELFRTGKQDSAGTFTAFYSTVIIDDYRSAPRRIKQISKAEAAPNLVLDMIWKMMKSPLRVGVYVPRERQEYGPEEAAFYGLDSEQGISPAQRVAFTLHEQLGYDSVLLNAGANFLSSEISALVVVRPSQLSARDLYDIRAYLAGGGKVFLLHGTWHFGLLDSGLAVKKVSTKSKRQWYGERESEISAKRMAGTLEEYLQELGITSKGRLLAAKEDALAYSVITPPLAAQQDLNAIPRFERGVRTLIPHLDGEFSENLLASMIPALPVKGGAVFDIDEDRLSKFGLKAETFLRAPPGSFAIRAPVQAENLRFAYSDEKRPWEELWSTSGDHDLEFNDANGMPLGIVIEGSFPFDASQAPPPQEGDTKTYQPPGDDFSHADGTLVVVGAPDLFEYLESGSRILTPWGQPTSGLLAENGPSIEASRVRLLSNVLDSMIHGKELIAVRQALVPVPRRLTPWSASEKLRWTLLIVGLIPACVALLGLGVTIHRRRRRRAYEIAAKALGRNAS